MTEVRTPTATWAQQPDGSWTPTPLAMASLGSSILDDLLARIAALEAPGGSVSGAAGVDDDDPGAGLVAWVDLDAPGGSDTGLAAVDDDDPGAGVLLWVDTDVVGEVSGAIEVGDAEPGAGAVLWFDTDA